MKLFVFAVLSIAAVSAAKSTCEPGKSFKYYCNRCTCEADGLTESAACTRMECVPGMWNEDGTLVESVSEPNPRDKRQTATCTPGTSFKMYCNTCHCPDSGSRDMAACTLIGCPEGVFNEDGSLKQPLSDPIPRNKRQAEGADATCAPGESFIRSCNICHCGNDGLRASAACTKAICPEFTYAEDDSAQ